ncbi:hypothetical protein MtrunA17_Chr2g0291881 [Medicago truncatula]|uniref:Uncharacterized protein n=1 Tax=Medicago truncatula TaxID=3880 RepID=A0A396JCB5_MEDTR|nr:hypothetical protein MtrunA17_Chr2g0291881 [Medicago truncatula]
MQVPSLYQRRNDELEVILEAHAGEIVTLYECCVNDVECAPGYTFTDGFARYTITSMNVSESVSKDSIDVSESVSRDSRVQVSDEYESRLFENPNINDFIYLGHLPCLEDFIKQQRNFEKLNPYV